MGLRDADRIRDLTLGHVRVEAQKDDLALPLVEHAEAAGKQKAVLALDERLGLARPVDGRVARLERCRIRARPLSVGRQLHAASAHA